MSGNADLRRSALQDGEQIFVNSTFSKAYDKTAMDSFRESREVFAALFSDPKKYAALKQALAEIMYRELRQGKVYSFEPATLSMVAESATEYGKKENP